MFFEKKNDMTYSIPRTQTFPSTFSGAHNWKTACYPHPLEYANAGTSFLNVLNWHTNGWITFVQSVIIHLQCYLEQSSLGSNFGWVLRWYRRTSKVGKIRVPHEMAAQSCWRSKGKEDVVSTLKFPPDDEYLQLSGSYGLRLFNMLHSVSISFRLSSSQAYTLVVICINFFFHFHRFTPPLISRVADSSDIFFASFSSLFYDIPRKLSCILVRF
jgi:hypothetical protein